MFVSVQIINANGCPGLPTVTDIVGCLDRRCAWPVGYVAEGTIPINSIYRPCGDSLEYSLANPGNEISARDSKGNARRPVLCLPREALLHDVIFITCSL